MTEAREIHETRQTMEMVRTQLWCSLILNVIMVTLTIVLLYAVHEGRQRTYNLEIRFGTLRSNQKVLLDRTGIEGEAIPPLPPRGEK